MSEQPREYIPPVVRMVPDDGDLMRHERERRENESDSRYGRAVWIRGMALQAAAALVAHSEYEEGSDRLYDTRHLAERFENWILLADINRQMKFVGEPVWPGDRAEEGKENDMTDEGR